MKCFLKAAVAVTLAMGLAGAAWAMSPDQAKSAIRQQARGQGLQAKDVSQAVSTLEQLVAKGVPVDHAYDVVKAAIDDGVRGRDLAAIARKTRPQPVAEMKDDITSPTRGEFGRSGGARGGREMGGLGSPAGGRRP